MCEEMPLTFIQMSLRVQLCQNVPVAQALCLSAPNGKRGYLVHFLMTLTNPAPPSLLIYFFHIGQYVFAVWG